MIFDAHVIVHVSAHIGARASHCKWRDFMSTPSEKFCDVDIDYMEY